MAFVEQSSHMGGITVCTPSQTVSSASSRSGRTHSIPRSSRAASSPHPAHSRYRIAYVWRSSFAYAGLPVGVPPQIASSMPAESRLTASWSGSA
ncbi:hypothetical protein ACFVFF_07610 [Streptomyces sp. NPDC057680]|uniref:hypothetical protein n=1 Tax=Streptomyces sp. NPDC057680 TaxID=3346208 RepID=UPI0036C51425